MNTTLAFADDDPDDGEEIPILPYAGTSGHSGSETSEHRARSEDADGTTADRQSTTLSALRSVGANGLTWAELADRCDWHHGQASGALSVLHRAGLIARLRETRNRCKVYVHPVHIDGRETEQYVSRIRRNDPLPDGHLPIILPADIVRKLANGAGGSTITIPPGVADQIRAAARASVDAEIRAAVGMSRDSER